MSSEQGEFSGTERFRILSKLGSGASGAVYEVHDRERDTTVALKALHQFEAGAIYRLKKEFRALADLSHPNLVQLYELQSDGERWFFTMEMVKGRDFLGYVRSGVQPGPTMHRYQEPPFTGVSTLPPVIESAFPADLESLIQPYDEARLRGALGQLAAGLSYLHGTGKLHRDIKPMNVMVTSRGRVVLLDLGLVHDIVSLRLYETREEEIVGTPPFMAPEQAMGKQLTPACDWYGVGAILYQALTGRIPFSGSLLKILSDKQSIDPQPPRQLCQSVPEDLDTLCRALLHRDPEQRPDGRQVLLAVGAPEGEAAKLQAASAPISDSAPFIGRERHLRALHDAHQTSRQGRSVTVLVPGTTGMGKTVLIHRFLADIRTSDQEVVVLVGRCYERESVPYKALDSLVDALGRYLRSLSSDQVEQLIPQDILALARLFPVLNLVKPVARANRQVLEIQDPREFRRRAFAALRELLQRLARRQPLVLHIDDLQWGDSDSGGLLGELLRPPDPPPLLLILAFRSEEATANPLLQFLFSSVTSEVRELVVGELSQVQAQKQALHLLSDSVPQARDLAATIARESAGNPFFVDALVRHTQSLAAKREATGAVPDLAQALAQTTLEAVIESRLSLLPDQARQLLEAIAVAGAPVAVSVAQQVAEVENLQAALAALRTHKLIRLRGSRADDQVESYHDRVRLAVMQQIDSQACRTYHSRLASALLAAGRADPEALAIHFLRSGQQLRAAEHAVQAAEEASQALAFERAARLYRFALEFPASDEEEHRALRIKLGNACANAGRGADAAESFLVAAAGSETADALELRRRAAEQLLISGHLDAGLETIRQVLNSIGMKLAPTPTRALIAMLWRKLRLRIRGIGYCERDIAAVASEQLIRIDTCWSVSIGLAIADPIRGMNYGTRHVLLALDAGEPYRVAKALAIEAGYSSTAGSKALARTETLIQAATELAHRVDHPHAIGLAKMTAGTASYLQGQWSRAKELLAEAEKILREGCTGVTWEIDTAFMFQFRALLWLGHYGTICRRLPALLADVGDRGDLFAETCLRTRVTWVAHLVRDEPDQAHEEADQAIRRWSQQGFNLQHYWHLTAMTEIAMYRGQASAGWQQLQELWTGLDRSLLLKIQFTRTEALHLRARCALAAAVEAGPDAPRYSLLRKVIERDLRRIEREHLLWADPLAKLVRAGLAACEGERDRAVEQLVEAIAGFEAAEMSMYAMGARRCWGHLIAGPRGRELVDEAEEWMTGQGIKRPDRITRVLAPGSWE